MAYMLELQNLHKTFNRGTINEKAALAILSWTGVSGSYDGYGRDYVDRGKYGNRGKTGRTARAWLGNHKEGTKEIPGTAERAGSWLGGTA